MAATYALLTIVSFIQSIYAQPYYIASENNNNGANDFYDYGGILQMAFPLNVCTKNGNVQSSAVYSLWQCSGSGGVIYGPCPYTAVDSTCSTGGFACNLNSNSPFIPASPGPNGEQCPSGTATTTTNYVQINYYCAFPNQSPSISQCPNDNLLFTDYGFTKLVTNVCVPQTKGQYNTKYLMTTCNNVTAEIGIYDDSGCTQRSGAHASYTRGCQSYAWPVPQDDKCRFYRRVSACMVNGVSILAATNQPTSAPSTNPTTDTSNPTKAPSSNPTKASSSNPTKAPTSNPTTDTSNPTKQPSTSPTKQPSTSPTKQPSTSPTKQPSTSPTKQPSTSPTSNPATIDPTNDVTTDPPNNSTVLSIAVDSIENYSATNTFQSSCFFFFFFFSIGI